MYEAGATLEEVGRAFNITRERVRQIFGEHGLPVRSVRDTYALQRARQTHENAERIMDAYRELRDVDAVAQALDLPKALVATIVRDGFTAAERRKPKLTRKKYTSEELVAFLRSASKALGGVLTAQGYTKYARTQKTSDGRPWPTHQTHALRFGSWREAVFAAGLTANPSSPIAGQTLFDDGHCIDALRAAARAIGRIPTAEDYEEFARASNGALPSQATVRHRLGTWYEVLARAGL
jgi:hypothetical protein